MDDTLGVTSKEDKPGVIHSCLDLRSPVCFIELTSVTCWRLSSDRQMAQSKFRNVPGLSHTSHPHRQGQLLSGPGQFKSEEQSSHGSCKATTHRLRRNQQEVACNSGHLEISNLCLFHVTFTPGWHGLASSTGNPSRLHQPVSSLTVLVTRRMLWPLAQTPLYSSLSLSRHRAALSHFLDSSLHRARLNSVVHSPQTTSTQAPSPAQTMS